MKVMATRKVLWISDHLGHAAGARHGASTYFLNVLPELRRAHVDFEACFLRVRHALAAELEQDGVSPIFLGRGKADPRALSDLIKLIREQGIAIVHAAGMKGILLGGLAARWTGCRFIPHLHDANPVHPMLRWGLRLLGGWMQVGICISEAVRDFAIHEIGWPEDRLVVLYNPLPNQLPDGDAETVSSLREALGWKDARVLLVMGRLSAEKGHESLLRDSAPWLRDHPEAHLVFAGDGPRRNAIVGEIQELGLQDRVHLLGFREDVWRLLAGADVLLIPSLREGLGYVAMEAMAAGCPVVARAVGGLPELIQDGVNGFLANNVSEMLEQAWSMVQDVALRERLVQNAQVRAEDFSMIKHIEELKALYR